MRETTIAMTVYAALSKEIGWEGKATIPSITEAQDLLNLVKMGDSYAFKKVFQIHRFAPTAISHAQHEAMVICFEAFAIGDAIFKQKEAK